MRRGKAAPSSTLRPAVGEFLSVYVVGGGQVTCRIMGDQRRMRKYDLRHLFYPGSS